MSESETAASPAVITIQPRTEELPFNMPADAFQVVRAELGQAFQLPNKGGVQNNLYAHRGIRLWYSSTGVFGMYKGGGIKEEAFVVPLANVKAVWISYDDQGKPGAR